MNRRILAVCLAGLCIAETGCMQKKTAPGTWSASAMMMTKLVDAASPDRFIAERHKLELVTSESDLQKSWEGTVAFCKTIRCEVVTSTITTRTGAEEPSGTITLRVVPEDLSSLLNYVQKVGQVAVHTTEREDKTSEVIDSEAKLKNLTSFRDGLRAMLAKRSASVQDIVEIQKQLTDTQAELDSETAQRKILANQTEKVAIEISFRVARTKSSRGALSEIQEAFVESGLTLADSIAALITVVVSLIPWLIVIIPGAWYFARVWRRLRRNRRTQLESPTTSPH